MKKLFLIFLSANLFFTTNIYAQDQSWQVTSNKTLTIATNYNQYLNNNQIDDAMKLVDKNVIFVDYTWSGEEVIGKEKLRDIYSASANTIHNPKLDVKKILTSRGTVVIHAVLSGEMDLIENSPVDKRFRGAADIIRVITVKNGKIIRHIDLMDYDSFMPKIAFQREKLVAELTK